MVSLVSDTSYEHLKDLKNEIEDADITKYEGQNIAAMARDFRRTAKKLKKEGAYDHDLTRTMLMKFADAGQDSSQSQVMQTYHFVVLQLRHKVDKALAQVRYMHNR